MSDSFTIIRPEILEGTDIAIVYTRNPKISDQTWVASWQKELHEVLLSEQVRRFILNMEHFTFINTDMLNVLRSIQQIAAEKGKDFIQAHIHTTLQEYYKHIEVSDPFVTVPTLRHAVYLEL